MYLKLVFGEKIWLRKNLLYIHRIYAEKMKFAFQKVCVPKIGFWGEILVPQEFALHTPNSCRNSGASCKLSLFFGGSRKSQFLENFRMNCMRRGHWGRAARTQRTAQRASATPASLLKTEPSPLRVVRKNRKNRQTVKFR